MKIEYTSRRTILGTVEEHSRNITHWVKELSEIIKDAFFRIDILCSLSLESVKRESFFSSFLTAVCAINVPGVLLIVSSVSVGHVLHCVSTQTIRTGNWI